MSNSESRADCSPAHPAVEDLDITRSPSRSSDSSFTRVNQSLNDTKNHSVSVLEQIDDNDQIPNKKPVDKAIVLHFAITIATIVTIITLLFLTVGPEVFNSDPGSCNPDGKFRYLHKYNPWATTGLFQVTLGFGSMSFANAKLIDVIWDVVVGRAGQGLLGYVAYSVFTKSLVRIMEQTPVSYGTFEAITFRNTTMFSLWLMIKDYTTNGDSRARVAVLWMLFASLYVLAFPTLMSAVTGYASNSQGFIRDVDDNLLPWSSLLPIVYVIHDGWRVELHKNQPVVTTWGSLTPPGAVAQGGYDVCQSSLPRRGLDGTMEWDTPEECLLLWHTAQYVERYGQGGITNLASTFNNGGTLTDLPAPALNITAFYTASGSFPSGDRYMHGTKWLNQNLSMFTTQRNRNKTFDTTFLLLWISMLLTAIWTLGMHILWLDAYFGSHYDCAHRSMGTHRAALDFASAMIKDMGGEAPPEHLSEKQLIRCRKKALNGGKIPRLNISRDDNGEAPQTRTKVLADQLKRRRWGEYWDRASER